MIIQAISIFIVNLPFGYWRNSVARFGYKWFLSIHLPVLYVIAVRYIWGAEGYVSYLLFVPAYFIGQYAGKYLSSALTDKLPSGNSGCIFLDISRIKRK
jgi:hypothetical protein